MIATSAATALTQQRIARLAADPRVHRAFHWLHLHQPQLRQWQMEMLSIPAPPFGEQPRAEWFRDRFNDLKLENVHIDEEGNALANLGAPHLDPETTPGVPRLAAETWDPSAPFILLSAHLDTVFPPEITTSPQADGARIVAPGACDNAAGLTALLALAAALRFAEIVPPIPILFAANVGEEGEGDLRGMKHLFQRGQYRQRIAASIALEGAGTSAVVTRALGSRRFRVTISGPGGHSWTDASAPNPITLLSRCLTALADLPLPVNPRTTLSPGHISGGTSVNSIPNSASALLDLRSTDPGQLVATELALHRTLEHLIARANRLNPTQMPAKLMIETIGNRPAGALPDDAPLLQTVRAVDRHLTLRTEPRIGSTDANLPLSLGIPAIAIAAGGTGDGIHTQAEWYDPTGRETALRRILLILLDTSSTTQKNFPPHHHV